MDNYFIYDKPVTGKYFVGRKRECRAITNLLLSSEHVTVYEPPKCGKDSVIQQTLFSMKMSSCKFSVCTMNALPMADMQDFLIRFGNSVIRAHCSTPNEYSEVVKTFLPGTHFVFDRQRFSDANEVVSANWDLDEHDCVEMLSLPGRLAEKREENIYMVIEEFQALAELEEGNAILRSFKKVMSERSLSINKCTFILTGSRYNAMKAIFGRSPMFRGVVEHVPLERIEDMDIAEHIKKGVNISGKVIEKDQVMGIINRFDNNMWYINHFMAICDSMTKGYFNDGIFMDALNCMLSVHEVRFVNTMCNLTGHQVSLLKAVLDGVTKFTASDVIRKYKLNSSANVSRVKEALMKKEIITFTDKDEPVLLDTLFKYWLETKYFAR